MHIQKIKKQFPVLKHQKKLVYLDSAATTLTAKPVIDAMNEYYTQYPANVHRGMYDIAVKADEKFAKARQKVAAFINADIEEIVFTSGTTAGLNMLVTSVKNRGKIENGRTKNIVLTRYEHHANLIPWQEMARELGMEVRFIEIGDDYTVDLASAKKLIDEHTLLVSFGLVSNTLGTLAPARELIEMANDVDALTVIDAAQAVAHMPIDVKELDCDFLVFSGHKMYGPKGIGVLYGKKEQLEALNPVVFGGDMIKEVSYEKASWADVPNKFEAGTPNIAAVIGLGVAVDFLQEIGWKAIQEHELNLTSLLVDTLVRIDGVEIIGPKDMEQRIGVVSFTLGDAHPHDVADLCAHMHIAVRAGHHCTMPLMKYLHLTGTTRASLGVYSTKKDVDEFIRVLETIKNILQIGKIHRLADNSPLDQQYRDIA